MAEVDGRRPGCERCLRLEEELRDLRLRFAASGQYVAFSPGPNPKPNVDDELGRWLATNLAQMQLLGFEQYGHDWPESLAPTTGLGGTLRACRGRQRGPQVSHACPA